LPDILALKIRISRENLVNRSAGSDETDYRSDGYPQSAHARLAAHNLGVQCNPLESLHFSL
jgi:hypothetical protein